MSPKIAMKMIIINHANIMVSVLNLKDQLSDKELQKDCYNRLAEMEIEVMTLLPQVQKTGDLSPENAHSLPNKLSVWSIGTFNFTNALKKRDYKTAWNRYGEIYKIVENIKKILN